MISLSNKKTFCLDVALSLCAGGYQTRYHIACNNCLRQFVHVDSESHEQPTVSEQHCRFEVENCQPYCHQLLSLDLNNLLQPSKLVCCLLPRPLRLLPWRPLLLSLLIVRTMDITGRSMYLSCCRNHH